MKGHRKFSKYFFCFAYSFHEDPSGFCGNNCPLYHVLIKNQYLEERLQRSVLSSCDVPRLFTCLKALHYYLLAKHIQRYKSFNKITVRVIYNEKIIKQKEISKRNIKQNCLIFEIHRKSVFKLKLTLYQHLKAIASLNYIIVSCSELSKIIDKMNSGYGYFKIIT